MALLIVIVLKSANSKHCIQHGDLQKGSGKRISRAEPYSDDYDYIDETGLVPQSIAFPRPLVKVN